MKGLRSIGAALSDRCSGLSEARIFFLLFPATILIKIYIASIGHGFDVGSWSDISRIVRDGGVVYASYQYYNYGPIWAWLLGLIGHCSEILPLSSSQENFHMWLALFLALVDIALAAALRFAGYPKVAIAFLLNPVTWLVSGFISQFDQLAILIGLLAVFALSRGEAAGRRRLVFLALAIILMSLSLIVKHLLVMFPVWLGFWWLARRKRGYLAALALALLPIGFFFLSFLPYWGDPAARAGIIQNVFRYQSNYLHSLVPKLLEWVGLLRFIEEGFSWAPVFSGYKLFWLLILVGIGWACRRKTVLELYLVYLIAFLLFSPGVWWYYPDIPLLACVFLWRFWEAKLYTLVTTLNLIYHTARKLPFLRELEWSKEIGLASFLHHYYENYPIYLPLIFLPFLLWRILSERIPADRWSSSPKEESS